MDKQPIRVLLDWRRLLGFDQATGAPDLTSSAPLGPKIGPKDARGFATHGSLGAKIGPKEARGFANLGAKIGVKLGFKEGLRKDAPPETN